MLNLTQNSNTPTTLSGGRIATTKPRFHGFQ